MTVYNEELVYEMDEAVDYVWTNLQRIGYPDDTLVDIATYVVFLVDARGETKAEDLAALTLEQFVRAATRPYHQPPKVHEHQQLGT